MRGLPWCVQSCPRPRGRGGAGGGGGSAASTTDKLPKGWKAVESAQGTYYFNKKTKETRWERPGSPPASSVSADAPLTLRQLLRWAAHGGRRCRR